MADQDRRRPGAVRRAPVERSDLEGLRVPLPREVRVEGRTRAPAGSMTVDGWGRWKMLARWSSGPVLPGLPEEFAEFWLARDRAGREARVVLTFRGE